MEKRGEYVGGRLGEYVVLRCIMRLRGYLCEWLCGVAYSIVCIWV